MAKLLREKVVFSDKLTLEKGELEQDGENYYRLRVKREDAAAVLVINTESKKVILTKQFRYAIAARTEEDILEIVAGKINEKEEDAVQCVLRETEEETCYKIRPGNLQIMLTCFSTPGYSSERFIVFLARVSNEDKITKGGGLKSEHEDISLVEMDTNEFIENIKTARFKDAKTYIAGLYMLSHNLFP